MSAASWLLVAAGVAVLPLESTLHLAPCPASPNCVSTQADPSDSVHRIEPLRWPQGMTPEAVLDDLVVVVDGATRTLHLRSAARLGQGDFGVNRRRAERLLDALAERVGGVRGGG